MTPIEFDGVNVTFAKDQPEYLPLPTWTDGQRVVSCWRLSWSERIRVLFSGRLWMSQLNFGSPLQPQLPSVEKPDMEPAV